jgi:Ca-activated chloride channel family protein
VSTIAFGTPTGTVTVRGETVRVPADTATMRHVADATGGTSYEASSAGELQDVYADIQTVVGTTTEQREVTRAAVGAGLVLVAAAFVVSMVWTARGLG